MKKLICLLVLLPALLQAAVVVAPGGSGGGPTNGITAGEAATIALTNAQIQARIATNPIPGWIIAATNAASALVGNVLYVSTNGDDSTAIRGEISKPFAKIERAFSNALAGDLVYVYPGPYNVSNMCRIPTNGSLYISEGATITNHFSKDVSASLSSTSGPMIVLNVGSAVYNYGVISDGLLQNPSLNTNRQQCPIGIFNNGIPGVQVTNAFVRGGTIYGWSECFSVEDQTNMCSVTVSDFTFSSAHSPVNVLGASHHVAMFDGTVTVTGTNWVTITVPEPNRSFYVYGAAGKRPKLWLQGVNTTSGYETNDPVFYVYSDAEATTNLVTIWGGSLANSGNTNLVVVDTSSSGYLDVVSTNAVLATDVIAPVGQWTYQANTAGVIASEKAFSSVPDLDSRLVAVLRSSTNYANSVATRTNDMTFVGATIVNGSLTVTGAMVLNTLTVGTLSVSNGLLTNLVQTYFSLSNSPTGVTNSGDVLITNFVWNLGTRHIELACSNNLALTNITGFAAGTVASSVVYVTPDHTIDLYWPTNALHGYKVWVCTNAPLPTTFLSGACYTLSATARGTNIHLACTKWQP